MSDLFGPSDKAPSREPIEIETTRRYEVSLNEVMALCGLPHGGENSFRSVKVEGGKLAIEIKQHVYPTRPATISPFPRRQCKQTVNHSAHDWLPFNDGTDPNNGYRRCSGYYDD
jgi:hypothetical protein